MTINGSLIIDNSKNNKSIPFSIKYGASNRKLDRIVIETLGFPEETSLVKFIQDFYGTDDSLPITSKLNLQRGLSEIGKLPVDSASIQLFMCSRNSGKLNVKPNKI